MIIVLLIAWHCAPPTAKNHKYLYVQKKTLGTAARASAVLHWLQREADIEKKKKERERERATNKEQEKSCESPQKSHVQKLS